MHNGAGLGNIGWSDSKNFPLIYTAFKVEKVIQKGFLWILNAVYQDSLNTQRDLSMDVSASVTAAAAELNARSAALKVDEEDDEDLTEEENAQLHDTTKKHT